MENPESEKVTSSSDVRETSSETLESDVRAEKRPRQKDERAGSAEKTSKTFERLSRQLPGWVTSLILHAALIFLLAYVTLPLSTPAELSLRSARIEESIDFEDELLEVNLDLENETLDETLEDNFDADPQVEILSEAFDSAAGNPLEQVAEVVDFSASVSDLNVSETREEATSSGFEGRSASSKANMLRSGGGTRSSERAVQAGLDWIAQHQFPDGSWSFDHSQSECQGRCGNAGSFDKSRAAATGLALLTYLGAGHTQEDGRYKRVVYRGIYALGNLIKVGKNGGSFRDSDGRLYSHGIATMALCEAYAMTGEPALRAPSQAAINYICYAQDPIGGGWRYEPQQPGDTSVMGWQIAALKSGYLSKLSVPPVTIQKASGFLDAMMVEEGKRYLYNLDPEHANDNRASTAIGLLCRMYMGIDKQDASLQTGLKAVSKRGPSKSDAYYNYYAAQALFHATGGKGPVWRKWNDEMRNMLVSTQMQDGHESGSWTPARENFKTRAGGRLYTTALSTMTLEVYYRMMPIYRPKAATEDFKFTNE